MKNRTKALLYELPGMIVLVASFIASLYVKVTGQYPLNWGTIIALLIINILFFIGKYYERKRDPFFGF